MAGTAETRFNLTLNKRTERGLENALPVHQIRPITVTALNLEFELNKRIAFNHNPG